MSEVVSEELTEKDIAFGTTYEYQCILAALEQDSELWVLTQPEDEDFEARYNHIDDQELIGMMKTWLKLKIGALSRILNS